MAGIIVKNLTKKFKEFRAVSNVTFEVAPGRIIGFLGPNGAGKTTTLRMMVGLSKPNDGSIEIAGKPIKFSNSSSNNKFGYLPEQPSFYGWMSGYEYLIFNAETFNMVGDDQKKAIKKVLNIVNLFEARDKKISSYSNGMKQRLGIAQALINDPEALIMDEPVSALDPIGRREVLNVISSLKGKKTILFSTHILSDVDKICDDVIIINKGRIITQSSITELKERYAKPILEIEVDCGAKDIADKLRTKEWVDRIEDHGNYIKIWLKDAHIVENNIPLQELIIQGKSVLKYGLVMPEVEDPFVNLVDGDK